MRTNTIWALFLLKLATDPMIPFPFSYFKIIKKEATGWYRFSLGWFLGRPLRTSHSQGGSLTLLLLSWLDLVTDVDLEIPN